ncbi:twitching motility protein PilT [Steroidobacter agaridevorans]|uniref:Ribonuclease VapC n=1 Tax=Steroidobacter agaridevorans TaxID=2695856 RepID=A0A829Y970_9GAMM|nr:PIN domain-containing protein [Steroidobacter agaridevorans]GFE79481.1 twitching motility protein PilT [Steroidobacter agaridevorans]
MTAIVFVDTNILVYAYDPAAGEKHIRATRALERLWEEQLGRVSVQVLQEFYVTATQKLKTPRANAREVVQTYAPWVQSPTTPEIIMRASDLSESARLSFWDALIVASAEQAEASQLYTEDLNAGQIIAGVKIINPLVPTEYDLSPATPGSVHEPTPPTYARRRRGRAAG